MHHDHDCDHHPFDPFFLIAFTHAHVLAGLGEGVEVESHRVELDLTWTPLFAHPPFDKPRSRLSRRAIDRLLGLEPPPSVGRPVIGAALALPDTSPDCKAYQKLIDELYNPAQSGIPERMEADARTWGDHGELFELPTGWRFQDNMIQGAIGEPGDKLFSVITYDGDNLPNPWEWQLHEAESSDPDALWEEVASTPDKPRAGWAPTLLAAMTRSRTAGELHIEDRRAAGGA